LGKRSDLAREVVIEKDILGVRILLLGHEHAFRSLQKGKADEADGISDYADDFGRMAARGAASTVQALAKKCLLDR
jgi:hypothetical protein